MKINILTIFPEMFTPLTESILGKARENGILEFNVVDIREYSTNKHNKTDDYPFGGGQGMVFMPQPVFDAIRACEKTEPPRLGPHGEKEEPSLFDEQPPRRIYLSPRGRMLDMELAEELSREEEITLLCGHYEGVDQRILDTWDFEEVSIGDYILTGGELAAMVLIDTFARMIPGVLSTRESAFEESIYSGLLEYPQYTQPREFEGLEVPEVLLSGNHKNIDLWRFEQSLILTKERRPDLFEAFLKRVPPMDKKAPKPQDCVDLSKDERKVLEKIRD